MAMTKYKPRLFRDKYLAEPRELFSLSLPLILAQLSHMAMGFVDTVVAGRVSPADLAAVAIGGSVWFPVMLFVADILMAITPIVAQQFGAGNHQAISAALRHGLWIALALGLAGFVLLRNMGWLLELRLLSKICG